MGLGIVKQNKVFLDGRGFIFEMFKESNEIMKDFQVKQVTVSTIFPGSVKAFHKHEKQTDIITCVKGNIRLVLWKPKEGKPVEKAVKENAIEKEVYFIGEQNPLSVKIPAGIYHGFSSIGGKKATIVYATNQEYNADDELRLPWDVLGKKVWEVENK
ncbi:MAG: dTDP-4-dehydrorhamnose 3,5-epimerase family protein [archaeon]